MPAPFSLELLAKLREALDYNPLTGEFTWKVARISYGGGVLPGDRAGIKNGRGDKDCYVQIGFDRKIYRAHILAYWFVIGQAIPDGLEIDHKDRDKWNNVWSNLRLRTRSRNNNNQTKRSDNTSGVRGVHKAKGDGRWFARINIDKVIYHLGTYDTFEQAVAARRAGELKYLGEYVSDRDQGAA